MKLRLNLSTTPPPNKRPFLLGAFVLGAIGVALLFLLSHAAYATWRSSRDLRANAAQWRKEIERDSARQAALAAYFRSPDAKQVLSRSQFLNSLIGQRSFPWTKIFVDLEKTLPPGVRIISIAPTLDNGRAKVKLAFGAATEDAKVKFLKSLEQSSSFSDVQPESEKSITNRAPGMSPAPGQIEVELTAWYETTS